ncbi:MAG: hypothetical protein COA54_07985 [Thiotrichaceae bacterium]|nr:MAG: hypothetical protein COA54_07985 [Thiotrichaceae bacterium]
MGGISQRAREGGANMPRDGRYIAKSQGRRCEYAQGWTVCHKEPGMAMWLCPGMDGMPQGARDNNKLRLAAMSADYFHNYLSRSHAGARHAGQDKK